MTAEPLAHDWDPETYARFRGLRLRPALDLLAQVGPLPEGAVVDLGCGTGSVGAALAERFGDRQRIGLDASPAMLAKAAETGAYHSLMEADLAGWQPEVAPALIFSNAALHWLPDHGALLPQLAGWLAPGGVLAVQMPRQFNAPSHRFLRDIAAAMFPDRFDFAHEEAPVKPAVAYWQMLAPLGQVTAWETDYVQWLDPVDDGHPVRRFTEGTALRPIAEKLDRAELAAFLAAYDTALGSAYPVLADGAALFPFRRCFFVLTV
ncbi:methyltransferase domain-containing protein [Paracoccaceae bacterium Fryx2]|nr:methyltransferase domain-containing protein [Paracoccaceae bacterium Fryx2]